METKAHYKNHLSRFYSWMLGDFKENVQKQKDLLIQNGISPKSNKRAVDLGCGSGIQSIALFELGFEVHAFDFSFELILELKNKNSEIKTYHQDIKTFTEAINFSPELVVCMGDTITHLGSLEEVRLLLTKIYKSLSKNGTLIISYRDLSNVRSDLERFIPVKSDENRILTCFLENDADFVKVFDLLYERENQNWKFSKSFYSKLKIPLKKLIIELEEIGFVVTTTTLPNGLEVVKAICK